MKYKKPIIEIIEFKIIENISSNTLNGWMEENSMQGAGIQDFLVNSL